MHQKGLGLVQQEQTDLTANGRSPANVTFLPSALDADVEQGIMGPVVMPLDLLESEYMGPIGVGTVLACKSRAMLQVSASQVPVIPVVPIADVGGITQSSVVSGAGPGLADTGAPAFTDCTPQVQTYLNVVYDTGSTNIWIASDLCTVGGCVKRDRRRFDHTKSSTFSFVGDQSELLSVKFGTGELKGPLGADKLHIGPMTVRQAFAMMQRQDGWIWDEVPIEGIVGLGFPSLSNTDNHPPFFDSVIKQRVLGHNEFAFYISRRNPAANAIMWGGVDDWFYNGSLEYFPVVDPHYWALELADLTLGNKFSLKQQRLSLADGLGWSGEEGGDRPAHVAVLDTGTSVLGFPSSVMPLLLDLLKDTSCSNLNEQDYPPMIITLRNTQNELRDLRLLSNVYMSRTDDSQVCSPSIMELDLPRDHGPGIVLGDVFLREYFSVYDRVDGTPRNARVALARSSPTREVIARLKNLTAAQQSLLNTGLGSMDSYTDDT